MLSLNRLFLTRCRWFAATFVLLSVLPDALPAQTASSDLGTRLIGQPLFLRGQWRENDLSFDRDGKPQKEYGTLSFTMTGIDVTTVEQKDDALHIEGQRIGIEFDKQENLKRVPIRGRGYTGKISINILGSAGSDYSRAIDVVFAPDLGSLLSQMPPYWLNYAGKHFLVAPSARDATTSRSKNPLQSEVNPSTQEPERFRSEAASGDGPVPRTEGMTTPRLISSVDPVFTDVARMLRYRGNVELYLWIEPDGSPNNIQIVRAAGLGLDEAALAAVKQYKFAPATKGGKPVRVTLYIDVSFHAL